MKFIPNQSIHFEICIRANPKKVSYLVWCKSVKNQSVSTRVNPRFLMLTKIQSNLIRLNPRLPIRINPKEVLNPNESEVRMIQTEFSIRIIPTSDSSGFKNCPDSFGFKVSDQLGLSRIDFLPICIKRNWNFVSDWLGYKFQNKSDWFGINFNPKFLPGNPPPFRTSFRNHASSIQNPMWAQIMHVLEKTSEIRSGNFLTYVFSVLAEKVPFEMRNIR